MLIDQGFQQQPLSLPPAWDDDLALKALLRRLLPAPVYAELDVELKGFQERLAGPIHKLALLADGPEAEPTLVQHDQWGQRVDVLQTSEGWRGLKGVAAEEGMVSIPVEKRQGEYSRLYGFAKGYLWAPESRYVGCPISMTDGAAQVIQLAGTPEMKAEILPRLISRDPKIAWTAAQLMTEKPGGSDVSLTETVAKPVDPANATEPGSAYILDGFKWFSSATDGDVALALARTSGKGSAGLSLFVIKLRDEQGKTQGVFIHRLKKKWGTKSLPTAELSINGAVGQLIGPLGRGVKTIATILNITRLHSAMSGVAALRRCISIAKSFAAVRHIGGEKGTLLIDNEMHTGTLVRCELTHRALLQFLMGLALLMGRAETLKEEELTTSEQDRLRLLTPVAKAFNADLSTNEMPHCMEALGGQGYMVENEIGRLIHDANVERIWEGTTNVLALDVVRVIIKSQGTAVGSFVEWASGILASVPSSLDIGSSKNLLASGLEQVVAATKEFLTPGTSPDPRLARPLLYLLGYIASSIYLVEQALWSSKTPGEDKDVDRLVVVRWVGSGALALAIKNVDELVKGDRRKQAAERRLEQELVYGGPSRQQGSKL